MNIKKKVEISSIIFTLLILTGCGYVKKSPQSGSGLPAKPPTNLANIPTTCKDPSGSYKPVKQILSKGSYNAKASLYQPISDPKGFIVADFNHDKQYDLLFIERLKSDIRLISCVSNRGRLVRGVSAFKVHETVGVDFQTISEIIRYENNELVLTINRHEHNWGSDVDISRYSYNNQVHDFVLQQQESISTSGDGTRSDTHEFYDLTTNHYKQSYVCRGSEEGCISRKIGGRIIPAKPRSTLLKPIKAVGRLIPN